MEKPTLARDTCGTCDSGNEFRPSFIRLLHIRVDTLPVGNAAMLEGESLPSISKAGGEIVRQGSQLFRIQSERDILVLYVWQGGKEFSDRNLDGS